MGCFRHFFLNFGNKKISSFGPSKGHNSVNIGSNLRPRTFSESREQELSFVGLIALLISAVLKSG